MSKGKMRSPSFVRSISSKLSMARGPTSRAVAPLPEQSRFSEVVTPRLDGLRSSDHDCGVSSSWIVDVLDVIIGSQIVAEESLSVNNSLITLSDVGREMIEDYLEDNVELLDACNGLIEKMSVIQKYIDFLRTTVRLIEGNNIEPTNVTTLARTQEIFKQCSELEGECATLDKCSPKLNKLVGKKSIQMSNNDIQEEELHEVLSGSKEIASIGCHLLQRALSFKSRQGSMKMRSKLPTTWSSSLNELKITMNENAERRKLCAPWMMKELEIMVANAKALHDQVKSQMRNVDIVSLKRSCAALEEGIIPLEERVRELYKHLISIRMTLLGILSRN
ncbi:hypothetical protein RND81_09G234700 [Saponaria officinalis]|uniref:Uncharacterized protein n=1 Tax=Saponaria officinalis TaxID=3572 RepID=A0AAW1IRD0_SAPOF